MNEAWTEAVGSACPHCGKEIPNIEALLKDLAMYQAAIRRVKLLLDRETNPALIVGIREHLVPAPQLREAILLEPELFPAQSSLTNADVERLKAWESFRASFHDIEYPSQGMGCGLEDRDITDRYEACAHGWERALDRVAEIMPEEA